MNGKVVYPELSAEFRTDEQLGRQGYQQHQLLVSPLNDLGIGLVTSFVLDYTVCTLWTCGQCVIFYFFG